ncbi:hypothetical protein HBB16_21690 [Pseudonocardia sp. MCCB 268]|nr:hypothetical protein [Pseudonocardia cytotoxica]
MEINGSPVGFHASSFPKASDRPGGRDLRVSDAYVDQVGRPAAGFLPGRLSSYPVTSTRSIATGKHLEFRPASSSRALTRTEVDDRLGRGTPPPGSPQFRVHGDGHLAGRRPPGPGRRPSTLTEEPARPAGARPAVRLASFPAGQGVRRRRSRGVLDAFHGGTRTRGVDDSGAHGGLWHRDRHRRRRHRRSRASCTRS